MRKWYKYSLDPDVHGKKLLGIDEGYEEHAKGMGGYDADEGYRSKSDFFNKPRLSIRGKSLMAAIRKIEQKTEEKQ